MRAGYAEDLEGVPDMCWVEVDDDDEKVGIELLHAKEYICLLDVAADQYDLDIDGIKAAAAAAIAAPMRFVTVEVEAEEVEEEEASVAA